MTRIHQKNQQLANSNREITSEKDKVIKKNGRNIVHEKKRRKGKHVSEEFLKNFGLELNHPSSQSTQKPVGRLVDPDLSIDHKTNHSKRPLLPKTNEKKEDIYVPKKVLEQKQEAHKFKSINQATSEAMLDEKTLFAKAKPASVGNLQAPEKVDKPQAFPKKSLTRLLTGDVRAEWITGLGRMSADKETPLEGYKDCFVSSLEEYEKMGINFNSDSLNDPLEMATKLDLKPSDLELVKNHGAWLLEIHPSSKLAIPTERKNEWNPGYIEGGYTGSGQQEWVTPNIGLDKEARAGRIKIFKMTPDGKTTEWKFFQGKLFPNIPNSSTGPVEGSYNHAIDTHIKNLRSNIK